MVKLDRGDRTIMIKRSKTYSTFTELYEDNKKLVYYYIHERMSENQDAEELSSQVWAKVGKHHQNLIGMDKPALKKYLILAIDSVITDDQRRLAREAKLFIFLEPSELEAVLGNAESVEDTLQRKAEQAYFREALQRLSEEERQILFLYRLQKKSSKEIAALLNTTDSNVRVRIHRLIEKLTSAYEEIKERGEGHLE